MTRRILSHIALDKIACVDKPCQEGAVVAIMKREEAVSRPEPAASDSPLAKVADTVAGDLARGDARSLKLILKQLNGEAVALVPALKHSLFSIMDEKAELRKAMIANSVQQFLDAVGKMDAADHLFQLLAIQRMHGRLTDLRGYLGKVRQLRTVKRKIERVKLKLDKQGYYVRLKDNQGGIKHVNVHAGNRRGARGQAMRQHPDHTVVHLHDKPHLAKVWSDEARRAAAEARKAKSHHGSMETYHRHMGGGKGDFTRGRKSHREAAAAHAQAFTFYEHAQGDHTPEQKAKFMNAARKQGRAANRMSSKLMPGGKRAYMRGVGHGVGAVAVGAGLSYLGSKLLGSSEPEKKTKKSYRDDVKRVKLRGDKMSYLGRGAPTKDDRGIGKIKPGQMRRTANPRVKDLHENSGLATYFSGGQGHLPVAALPMARTQKQRMARPRTPRMPKPKVTSLSRLTARGMRTRRGSTYGAPRMISYAAPDVAKQRLGGGRASPKPMRAAFHSPGPRRGRQGPRQAAHELATLGPRGKPPQLREGKPGSRMKERKIMLVQKLLGASIDKKLPKGAGAADYIHDFVHSSDKRFAGKSRKERIRMALGAFYGNK